MIDTIQRNLVVRKDALPGKVVGHEREIGKTHRQQGDAGEVEPSRNQEKADDDQPRHTEQQEGDGAGRELV